MADVLREQDALDVAAREQLAEQVDDPALAVALGRREGHPEEVELDARAALDDRQVVVEMRVRVGVADDDPRRVRALLLEDPQLVEPDRRQDGVGRDGQAGPSGGPGRRPMDALLLRRHPRLVGADLADDARAGRRVSPTPSVASRDELVGEVVDRPPVDPGLGG